MPEIEGISKEEQPKRKQEEYGDNPESLEMLKQDLDNIDHIQDELKGIYLSKISKVDEFLKMSKFRSVFSIEQFTTLAILLTVLVLLNDLILNYSKKSILNCACTKFLALAK